MRAGGGAGVRWVWRLRPIWPGTTACARPLVRRVLDSSGLVEVSVAGWAQAAYADPGALGAVGTRTARAHGAALTVRLAHLVPGARRAPLRPASPARGLHAEGEAGLRLLRHAGARRDPHCGPGRPGSAGRGAGGQAGDAAPRPDAAGPVARAIAEAASWVGCTECEVERVEPASARAAVRAEVASALAG